MTFIVSSSELPVLIDFGFLQVLIEQEELHFFGIVENILKKKIDFNCLHHGRF